MSGEDGIVGHAVIIDESVAGFELTFVEEARQSTAPGIHA